MKILEIIIVSIIIFLSVAYLAHRFYRSWKSINDPSQPSSCGDGCCSCSDSSCKDKQFPPTDLNS